MRKFVLMMVLMIFLSPSINAEDDSYIAQFRFDIPNPEPVSTVLEECFIELDLTDNCSRDSDSVSLSWWLWSDQTNSNWPDDDAKSIQQSIIYLQISTLNRFLSSTSMSPKLKPWNIIQNSIQVCPSSIYGEIIIVDGDTGPWYIRMPIEMTPSENLTDDTLHFSK